MILKKAPSDKRAVLLRASDRAKAFVKDWTRQTHSGRFDHALVGDWADHRECHVGGDFLLIYQLQGSGVNEQIIFVRVGTHADLFE